MDKEEIKKRKEKLEQELQEFVRGAERHISYLEGSIHTLKELLGEDPDKNEPSGEAVDESAS